jgi:hypothetical protein
VFSKCTSDTLDKATACAVANLTSVSNNNVAGSGSTTTQTTLASQTSANAFSTLLDHLMYTTDQTLWNDEMSTTLDNSSATSVALLQDFGYSPLLVIETLAAMSDDDRRLLGYEEEDLIVDCQYSGYSCTAANFTWSYNPSLGNCYTFNSGWDPDQSLFVTNVPGSRYGTFERITLLSLVCGEEYDKRNVLMLSNVTCDTGLELLLNIAQDDYVPDVGVVAGVRVSIHEQNEMPFPDELGFTAMPGYATVASVTQVTQLFMVDTRHRWVTGYNQR